MIKKAVWSFWDSKRVAVNGGFSKKSDLGCMLALSLELGKKQFEKTELVTNQYGKELLIDKYQLPFDSVVLLPEKFDTELHPDHWAYIKIYAYSIQSEPFIHIDCDVLIWGKISEQKLSSPLLFQNKETLEEHPSYHRLIAQAKGFPKVNSEILLSNPQWALNCGVVGCNDLEIIKEWKKLVDEYLFHPKNQKIWDKVKDKHSQNHLFEQYFISCLVKNKGTKVETLLSEDFHRDAVTKFKYTHLWGETKRESTTMLRVRNRLFSEFPQYREIFSKLQTHSEIFDDIYRNELWGRGMGSGQGSSPEITFEYRLFLQKFLEDKQIKSVVDLGCGDWQFSHLIDWDDISYLGLDCVDTVIEKNKKEFGSEVVKFEYFDGIQELSYSADLLIIKDVFIHWPNELILEFLKKLENSRNFKYVLITNQVDQNFNTNISQPGEYHSVDLNKAPFNLNCEEIFKWKNDPKVTYLLEYVRP